MRPRKQILLVCDNEFRSTELRLVIETRMACRVTIANGIAIPVAVNTRYFHCAVLTYSDKEVIDFLRRKEVPTLEIGNAPSFADRAINGAMMDVLEAVRLVCSRKRGPKVRKTA